MESLSKESPHTTKLKSFFDLAVQKWWVVYGSGLVIIIAAFASHPPLPTDEIVFYPWIMVRENTGFLFWSLLLLITLGSILYGIKRQSVILPILLAIITSVFGLAAIGPYVGRIIQYPKPDSTITHVNAMRIGDYVYNLATHATFYEAIGQSYILYKCDSLGINCRASYRYKPTSLQDAYDDRDNAPFLSSDDTNLSLHIGGKVVYTLPISTNS